MSEAFRPELPEDPLGPQMLLGSFVLWYARHHEHGISKGYIECNLRPAISSMRNYLGQPPRVSDLTEEKFNAWVVWMATQQQAVETARARIRAIRVLWNAAAIEKLITGRAGLKLRHVKKESKTPIAWTEAEITKLIEVALSRDDTKDNLAKKGIGTAKRPEYFASLLAAGFSTGLRLGDLFSVARTDLVRQPDGSAVISKPMNKTNRIHNSYLSPHVMLLVDRLLSQHKYELVWQHTGKQFNNPFYRFVNRLVAEAGIRPGTMRFTRRAAATQAELIQEGLGTRMLGHASRCTTIDSYIDSTQLPAVGQQLADVVPGKHLHVNPALALHMADDLPISVPRLVGVAARIIERLRHGPATKAQLNECVGGKYNASAYICDARKWLNEYLNATIVSERFSLQVATYRIRMEPGSKFEDWLHPRMPGSDIQAIPRDEMRERVRRQPQLLKELGDLAAAKRKLFSEREDYLRQVSAKLEAIDNEAIDAEAQISAAKRYRLALIDQCPDETIRIELSRAKQQLWTLMHGDNGVADRRIELARDVELAETALAKANEAGDLILIEDAEDQLGVAIRVHQRTVERIAQTEALVDELEQRAINS